MVAINKLVENISVPPCVFFHIRSDRAGWTLCYIAGPRGQKLLIVPDVINLKLDREEGTLYAIVFNIENEALLKTVVQRINSTIKGLSEGFFEILEIRGPGYQLKKEPRTISLLLGTSHWKVFDVPPGTIFNTLGPKEKHIIFEANDADQLGQVLADLMRIKPAGVYTEKGVYKKYERSTLRPGKKKKV